ncbi:MAG TPA: hypothetical protein VNM43_12310 [Dehalococcoidia bacterium]|nr:hypothetical protein [Dehalococcoidia bacterium]
MTSAGSSFVELSREYEWLRARYLRLARELGLEAEAEGEAPAEPELNVGNPDALEELERLASRLREIETQQVGQLALL